MDCNSLGFCVSHSLVFSSAVCLSVCLSVCLYHLFVLSLVVCTTSAFDHDDLSLKWPVIELGSSKSTLSNYTACADFPNVVAQRHIFGWCAARGLWPQIWTRPIFFVQGTYPQVSSSCVYSFGSHRVEKQTNKQTNAAENIQRSAALRRWVNSEGLTK